MSHQQVIYTRDTHTRVCTAAQPCGLDEVQVLGRNISGLRRKPSTIVTMPVVDLSVTVVREMADGDSAGNEEQVLMESVRANTLK